MDIWFHSEETKSPLQCIKIDKPYKEDEALLQSNIDKYNASDMKYHDQNNIDMIIELTTKNKSDLLKVRSFQNSVVHY